MNGRNRVRRVRLAALAATLVAVAALVANSVASARSQDTTITVDTLPIANALPLDLGVNKGFFAKYGITIKKQVFNSGNDIALALANHNGDIGYLGYEPMMAASISIAPFTLIAASEVEGTSVEDNWQDIVVKGNSPIKTPADLAGKTVSTNALKGLGEVVIRASLQKLGVDPNSVKIVAIPFPSERAALNSGQVDAVHLPEPFLTQALNIDGDRILYAPGPTLGKYWPNGGYAALSSWVSGNKALANNFRKAIDQSLSYAQNHPDEIRALLPAATQNVRLPIWTPFIDRKQLLTLAQYTKKFGVIPSIPSFTTMFPSDIRSGFATGTLEAAIGKAVSVRYAGHVAERIDPGKYTLIVKDTSKTAGFKITGPGVSKSTGVAQTGTVRFSLTLAPGTYKFVSVGKGRSSKGHFTVTR
jgi:NitT/TauT family transport system substrate-binding protein